ncbi:Polysaccharide export protein (Fragment) OS=Rhodopirellula maiorica SM1 GN=RMSM_03930 PE=4 SV=1: Poly_export: SLBB [Tuwongella immobilis]|uniref:Soluble ligand binding domain-containing protein n=2 Tax=Tuwongella immobilis TaxID=692036 RepID=A0A6C2YV08_9BACT
MLLVLATTGCTSLDPSTLSGGRNPLLKPAEQLRHDEAVEAPRELAKVALAEYRVEPGDGLLVVPVDLESPVHIPSEQTVLPDGSIDLGEYGRHIVIGKTVAEIEAMVATIVKAKTPNAGFIDVRLINRVSKVYYVLGEVNTPGVFQYTGRETVLDAILAAGGLTDKASQRKIILTRPSDPCSPRTILRVCYREIVQLGDTSTNYQLQPGDRIFVASAGMLDFIHDHGKFCGTHRKSFLSRLRCGVNCEPCATAAEPCTTCAPTTTIAANGSAGSTAVVVPSATLTSQPASSDPVTTTPVSTTTTTTKAAAPAIPATPTSSDPAPSGVQPLVLPDIK